MILFVSVPFRGISFLNTIQRAENVGFEPFPSPSGVSHFSMRSCLYPTNRVFTSFRPLPGYLISQSFIVPLYDSIFSFRPLPGYLISQSEKERVLYPCSGRSFRPLPGYLISQCVIVIKHWRMHNCFRPLPGYLISQFYPDGLLTCLVGWFPSPSGVSHFSM